ncbi:MAG TPA: hypothetical protein VLR89_00340 [Anaerolineaceae bacterium]|nr:hypothetical protein [Anaerolineaceae bacterium]
MSDPVSKTPEESKLPADDGQGVKTTAFNPEGMVVTSVTPIPEETPTLRCNRCGKPITPAEAILTPTGYRCRDCVNKQQKIFDTAKGLDLPLGFVIALVISLAGSWVAGFLGFITIFLASGLGLLIFNLVNKLIKHRRDRKLKWVLGAGALIGSLPVLLIQGLPAFSGMLRTGNPAFLLSLIWPALYTLLITTSVYAQAK